LQLLTNVSHVLVINAKSACTPWIIFSYVGVRLGFFVNSVLIRVYLKFLLIYLLEGDQTTRIYLVTAVLRE